MKNFYLLICLLTIVSHSVYSQSVISTFAGLGGPTAFGGDGGPATLAHLNEPVAVTKDASGNMYVADALNQRIRKINTAGIITTIAGTGTAGLSGDGGPAVAAQLNYPKGCTVDASGNIYIVDEYNCRIRLINTSGIISTFAGDGGPATLAKLREPEYLAIGPGGDIYITDAGNNCVRKVNSAGIISTVAGIGGAAAGYSGDGGPATAAKFSGPYCVKFDAGGNMYISDLGNARVRKVNTSGIVSTIAGNGTYGFSGDGGPATLAQMTSANGMAIDGAGNVYVCTLDDYRVRKINSLGIITTIAGNGVPTYTGDGVDPLLAGIEPADIFLIDSAHYYLADAAAGRIRLIAPPICTGVPIAGTVNATATSGCGTYSTSLSLAGSTVASALAYQWQFSTDNSTWSLVSGVTTTTYTATVTTPVYYRSIVSCTATGTSDTTLSIFLDDPVPVLSSISGAATICVGTSATFTDTAIGGTWSSANPTVATVDPSTGVVTGISGGTVMIIYTQTNACGTTTVNTTVSIVPPPTPVAIFGPSNVCFGSTITLSDSDPGGTWTSGNNAVASVNTSGVVTGVSAGTVNMTYTLIGTCGSGIATRLITVNPLPNAGVITGSTNLCMSSTTTLSNAIGGGTWSSINPSIVTINPWGTLTGIAVGTSTISYAIGNVCGVAYAIKVVTVNPLPTVSPILGSSNVCPGTSTTLTDATPSGTWLSMSPSTATIASGGVLTGVSVGTSTISYTVTNIFGCSSAATVTISVNAIPSGAIVPSGSVTICTAGTATLSASTGTGYTYQWQIGGVPIAGATIATYTAAAAGSYNAVIANLAGCSIVTSSTVVVVSATFTVVPSVAIVATPGMNVCTGTSVLFSATPLNGGSAPAYQWYVNSTAMGTGAATFSYIPANGDTIKCRMTSSNPCALPISTISSLIVTVNPFVSPSVIINAAPNDTVCSGEEISYIPTVVNGGTYPTFLWILNGINVATGPTYSNPLPHNGDIVICKVTSNHSCLTSSTATSAPFTTTVLSPLTNTLTVTVSSTNVSSGTSVTFVAASPYATAFQWYVNGTPISGATTSVFITSSLTDGEIINCAATSSRPCVSPVTIIGGGLTMHVSSDVDQVGISKTFGIMPNPNRGHLQITSKIDGPIDVILTDVLGHEVFRWNGEIKNGSLKDPIVFEKSLANGLYMLRILSSIEQAVFRVTLER
jgi:sugar lactone lactonase YvrE